MSIEETSNLCIARVGQEAKLADELASLKEHFSQADPKPHVIIDMTEIKAIDSSHLSQLLRLRKQVSDAGVSLFIVSVRDPIWNVIITTGLDRLFSFAADVDAATAEIKTD